MGLFGASCGVLGVFGSLASVLFDLITVIVFSFYIAGAGPGLVQRLAVWLPHERQLVLGDNVDLDRIQAAYRDGVLRLHQLRPFPPSDVEGSLRSPELAKSVINLKAKAPTSAKSKRQKTA